MRRAVAIALVGLGLVGCSSAPNTVVPAPVPTDQQLFAPVAMRLHPVFTKLADFDGDGNLDGIEAVLEFQDQFGDPTKAAGRVLFDIYQFKPYNPDPRGTHLAGPFEGRLDSMADQRARWNRVNRAYIFQLAYPSVKMTDDYVVTATFERTDGGRFFTQLMLEGEHIRPGTTAPAPIITTLPSTNPAPSTGGTNSTPAPATPGGPVTQPTPQELTVPPSQSHEPPPRTDQP
ncbi:MAG: hypothetical protein ACTHM6_09095 [Tepidisphaeraceae bacterium]